MKKTDKIPRGRPRSDAAKKAVLESTFAMLKERGYEAMAIETVAQSSGVAKTTIYRWWPDKATLAVDAFFSCTQSDLAFPDTGKIKDDFYQQIMQLADFLRDGNGRALAAMVSGGRTDPVLAVALGERWLNPRRKWGMERMQRAIDTNQCKKEVSVQAALSLMYAPLYTPLLFGQNVPDKKQVEAYLSLAMRSIFK